MKLRVKAFAKVNPYLKIISREDDGFHRLKLSFLSIDLADEITFTPLEERRVEVAMDGEVPEEENLAFKVGNDLLRECNEDDRGAKVVIEKGIPTGAGLGGGSTDAAATLAGLNELWGCGLDRESMAKIGEKYGSDIPFFFYGGFCRGEDRGTRVRKEKNPFADRLVPVIAPDFSQMTAEAYGKYDEFTDDEDTAEVDELTILADNHLDDFRIINDLQGPVLEIHPELEGYIELLESCQSVQTAGLTGSGSALFGITYPGVTRFQLAGELKALPGGTSLFMTRPTPAGQALAEMRW